MLAELQTRRPNQYSPIETEGDIQNRRLKLKKAGCDLLLLLLCRHHPEQAILALKRIKTKAKDDAAPPLTKIIVSKIMAPPPPPKPIVVPLPVADPAEPSMDSERRPTLKAIIETVAGFYELPTSDIWGECRQLFIMRARHVAMYLCRELTINSFPKIGRQFGGRDHSTILYAWCKISVAVGDIRNGGGHLESHYGKNFSEVVKFDARLKDEVDVLKLRLRQALLNDNPETTNATPLPIAQH